MYSPLWLFKIIAYIFALSISVILIISILTGISVNVLIVKLLKKLHIKNPNQGNFWKYQPICFEYTNRIESIKGIKIPIDIKDKYQLNREKYFINKTKPRNWSIENSKIVNAFLNEHLYKPEEKTLAYYDFINPIFFEVWDVDKKYQKLLGTVSIQSVNCMLDDVKLLGYFGDHLCTHSKYRGKGITPGMIQLLYQELNNNYISKNNTETGLPVIFFRVDNEPLPHGQKYLCQLEYYSKEIEINNKNEVENDNGDEMKNENDGGDEMRDEIDWKKWYTVHLNKKVVLKTIFDSLNNFKTHFSHSYLKKYQSKDGKVLIIYCESWKNQKKHNEKQKIYEIHEIFIEKDESGYQDKLKLYINAFEKWLSSKNDSNFLIVSNNCSDKYQWCDVMYERNEGHNSYLYVFNLNFTHEYKPEEIDLCIL